MDLRTASAAAIVCLCLIVARSDCQPTHGSEQRTLQDIRHQIERALKYFTAPTLPSNISCESLNVTEAFWPENATAHDLPSYICFMMKISKQIPQLKEYLMVASQYADDLGRKMKIKTVPRPECGLRNFDKASERALDAKCLLQRVQIRLSNTSV